MPDATPNANDLKAAFKAFKRRLKLLRLDVESKLNYSPLSGGRGSGIVAIMPPGDFPQTVFFTGQLLFQRERWYQRLLHNQTAFAIQKRLQWDGMPMVIMPIRVREG